MAQRAPDQRRRLVRWPRPPHPGTWLPLLLVVSLAVMIVLVNGSAGLQGPPPIPARHAARPLLPSRLPGAPRVVRALFVGASVDRGMFATGVEHTYPMLVADALEHSGDRVIWSLDARTGATAGEGLTWTFPVHQDLVVVHLVTNDYGGALTPLPTYQVQYAQVLDKIRRGSPNARLICLGAWNASQRRNALGATVADYDREVQAGCLAHAGTFVSLSPIFVHPADRGPRGALTPYGIADDYHPNDVGERAIANAVIAAIRR